MNFVCWISVVVYWTNIDVCLKMNCVYWTNIVVCLISVVVCWSKKFVCWINIIVYWWYMWPGGEAANPISVPFIIEAGIFGWNLAPKFLRQNPSGILLITHWTDSCILSIFLIESGKETEAPWCLIDFTVIFVVRIKHVSNRTKYLQGFKSRWKIY